MKDILKYKEFISSIHYSSDDEVFFGKIEGISDLITFEGTTVSELKSSFHEAIDDYLFLCEEASKDPLKSYKGSFNVRVSSDLHKKASEIATIEGKTLNQFVQQAIEHECFTIYEKKPERP
jgi:predicted HicB family RNase H-like nuclease